LIGNGSAAMAKKFAEHNQFPAAMRMLTDPKRAAYKAAGFKRSMLATLSPAGLMNFLRAAKKGFKQGKTQGDPWQMGGSLIVKPSGEVIWKYRSEAPGDHVSPETLLAKL
jgi:hypothetical protein